MSTIALVPWPELGHINASTGIARALQRRGHHVRYFSTIDHAPYLRAQGFACDTILTRAYPTGSSRELATLSIGGLGGAMAARRRAERLHQELVAQPIGPALDGAGAELVLVDRLLPLVALQAYASRRPTCVLATTLSFAPNDASPPPPAAWLSSTPLLNRGAWTALAVRRSARRALARLAGLGDWSERYAHEAHRLGVDDLLCGGDGIGAPQLALPHLVTCPRWLEPGAPSAPFAHYAAAIDDERTEPASTVVFPDNGRPNVYCSLGSQAHRSDLASFFAAAADAFARLDRVNFIVVVGRDAEAPRPRWSANVQPVAHAPQLALLRQASAAITHGGLGTINECLFFGVPMVAVPIGWDQPGNAARLERRSLGLRLSLRRARPAQLVAAIERALTDPSLRATVQARSRQFRAELRAAPFCAHLERLIGTVARLPLGRCEA